MTDDHLDFQTATLFDGLELATHLRRADRDELRALGHDEIAPVIIESIEKSEIKVAVRCLHTGRLICIYGFAPLALISGAAAPWMMATDLLDEHRTAFMRRSKSIVALARQAYTYQMNMVAWNNTDVVSYLKWLGYRFGEPFEHPETGELVAQFTMVGDFNV
jgi:hypothetical protein